MRAPLMALLALAACGEPKSHVRLSLAAAGDEGPLAGQAGAIELGGDVTAYSILARVSRASIEADGGSAATSSAVSVDLMRGGLLLEAEMQPGSVHSVTLELATPPAGSGIDPGQHAALFIGGLLGGLHLEYRDEAMQPLTFSGGSIAEGEQEVALRLSTKQWFEGVETETLAASAGRILLDAYNNAAAASQVEANIRASGHVEVEDRSEEPESVDSSSSEMSGGSEP